MLLVGTFNLALLVCIPVPRAVPDGTGGKMSQSHCAGGGHKSMGQCHKVPRTVYAEIGR